jgi:hypothetical protein
MCVRPATRAMLVSLMIRSLDRERQHYKLAWSHACLAPPQLVPSHALPRKT